MLRVKLHRSSASYSDDPLLIFGLAELDSELGNDLEAIKRLCSTR